MLHNNNNLQHLELLLYFQVLVGFLGVPRHVSLFANISFRRIDTALEVT